MVWATFVTALATFLVVVVSAFMAYLHFRQVEFQLRPRFEAGLELDERTKELCIVFRNRGDIPLKADIYIYICLCEAQEVTFLKKRAPLPEPIREKIRLPMLNHLTADLHGEGDVRRWLAEGAVHEFIQVNHVDMELNPFFLVRFDGQFWATVTRWPFKTKWPFQRLYAIYERENQWHIAHEEFLDQQ